MSELLLKAEFHVDGVVRRLEVFGHAASDLREPLARSGGYLRGQAKHRIDQQGPGWKALDEETVRRKMTHAKLQLLEAMFPRRRPGTTPLLKAADALAVARGRAESAKTTRARETALARAKQEGEKLAFYQRAFGAPAKVGRRVRGKDGRFESVVDVAALISFVQREQRRARLHGEALRAARALPQGSAERRRVSRIGAQRYQRSERSTRLLGGLYDSLHLAVEAKLVKVFSGPRWSGVHNEGGTAGNGATIPERRFLQITSADVHFVVEMFRHYLLEALLS